MIEFDYKKSMYPSQVRHTTLYKKAITIYELSRKLNKHNHLITSFNESCSLDQMRLREGLTMLSVRLPYTIALAHTTSNYGLKLRSSNLVLQSIEGLRSYCKELKSSASRDKDDLNMLYKELGSFSKLCKHWRIMVTQEN